MPLLTLKQAAEELSISERQLLYITNDGDLPFINIGRGKRTVRRYDPSDIQHFINRKKTMVSAHSAATPKRRRLTSGVDANFPIVDFAKILQEYRESKKKSSRSAPKA